VLVHVDADLASLRPEQVEGHQAQAVQHGGGAAGGDGEQRACAQRELASARSYRRSRVLRQYFARRARKNAAR
jgi:hypothetical protein